MVIPQVGIQFRQIQRKGKNTFPPVPCEPCLLHYNSCLAPLFVWVQSVSVLAVFFHHLWLVEGYPLPTNFPEFFFTHMLIHPIGGYQHRDILLIFHSEYMKRHIVKLTKNCIHGPNILVSEVSHDIILINIVLPVPPLVDKRGPIHYPLSYRQQY